MKWVLVLIVLQGVNPGAKQGGVYNSMIACFDARELFMEAALSERPAQAVCIRAATKA
jgi:hypothetical protein